MIKVVKVAVIVAVVVKRKRVVYGITEDESDYSSETENSQVFG